MHEGEYKCGIFLQFRPVLLSGTCKFFHVSRAYKSKMYPGMAARNLLKITHRYAGLDTATPQTYNQYADKETAYPLVKEKY